MYISRRNSDGPLMNCPRKFRTRLLLGLLPALACGILPRPGLAQQTRPQSALPSAPQGPGAQDPRGRIRTTVSLVVVPVTVKGGGGELITDLNQQDFRVFEDGVEQEISLFSAEAFPLSAAVLLDDDLKRSSADKVQKTLQTLAAGFSALDEVSLWRFDEVPQMVADFIADNDALLTQLKRVDLNSSIPGLGSDPMTSGPRVNTQAPTGPLKSQPAGHASNKHIHDAIYAAAEQLRDRPRERRKIIFLVSDGQNVKNNTHSYDETLKLLLSADISIYAVGVGEANLNRGVNILAKYAHATGGDIFYAAGREDLESLYPRASEQARNQYTLAYVPAKTDRTQPYHTVEVRVKRPGLSVFARDGYYFNAQP